MLPNIDKSFYVRFKKEGYRKKKFQEAPVPSINDIVHLGYLDVCRTIVGIKTEQRIRRLFKQTVVDFINALLSTPPENQKDFDILHHQCCRQCLEARSPKRLRIHYGQAQKLLNMSLKYLYNEFALYYGDLNQFRFQDNNIEHLFHLPIDKQIRKHLVKYCNFSDPAPSKAWSQWDYDHYISLQSQLRSRINKNYKPLEIDYLLWNTEEASLEHAID